MDYTLQTPLVIGGPEDAEKIRRINTPFPDNTYISTITAAYNGLMKSTADEQWLIVLTDGNKFSEDETSKEMGEEDTRARLSEVLSDYSKKVKTLYMGIGAKAAVPDMSVKAAYAPVAAAPAEVPEKLSIMCLAVETTGGKALGGLVTYLGNRMLDKGVQIVTTKLSGKAHGFNRGMKAP
ncbi:MAG: hypothetical protein MJ059_09140, partial [Lachnospiraceae bacterium]|nr:hypothetical protein [Lachnospiraceae bacterium]